MISTQEDKRFVVSASMWIVEWVVAGNWMEREYKEESAIEGIAGTLARDQFPRTVGPLHDPHVHPYTTK
jgi:hypothetical protein